MRTLPADVYDTLELTAEMFGGIGAGNWYVGPKAAAMQFDWNVHDPLCYVGQLAYADAVPGFMAMEPYGIGETESDHAVWNVNGRPLGERTNDRIPFSEWCAEMKVVRGED